jgi:hypothetical protein
LDLNLFKYDLYLLPQHFEGINASLVEKKSSTKQEKIPDSLK